MINAVAAFPGIVELSTDPLGAPVLLALGVVAAWCLVSLIEHGHRKSKPHNEKGHDRSGGWW